MFTGIIESIAQVEKITHHKKNLTLTLSSFLTQEFKVDQSLSHNGVCLTVEEIKGNMYTVTAIDETLEKTNLNDLELLDKVNLERAMKLGDRLDGHIVQGHVDALGVVKEISSHDGSYLITINHAPENSNLLVEKGSICINGVSLTAFNCREDTFSVAIIPYTWEHTQLCSTVIGQKVNLEYDILGKYANRLMASHLDKLNMTN